jgi:hypothetical protein
VDFTNPARRLYDVLDNANRQDHNKITFAVWAEVFGIGQDNEEEIVHRFFQLRRLYSEAVRTMESIEELNAALYLRWVAPVGEIFHLHTFQHHWSQTRTPLTAIVMQALEFSAEELTKRHQERLIPQEQLKSIQDDLAALGDKIIESSLDDNLKTLLLREVGRLQRAISEYRIRGAAALQEAFEEAVGVIAVHHSEFAPIRENEVLQGFYRIMFDMLKAFNFALDVQQIAEFVTKVLPFPK